MGYIFTDPDQYQHSVTTLVPGDVVDPMRRADGRDLLVLSIKEEPAVKVEAFALGANDYIVKLPDRLELLARVRYHSKGYINLLQRNEAYEALSESRRRLANEMKQAVHYVQSLLPDKLKKGGIRTDRRCVPSAELGGDSFGYHWLDDDHFAFDLLGRSRDQDDVERNSLFTEGVFC